MGYPFQPDDPEPWPEDPDHPLNKPATEVTMSEWQDIKLADRSKVYDLAISDGKGWRDRVPDCFWRKGGKHGKAGWYTASPLLGDGPVPVKFAEGICEITHFLEIPEIPR